MFLCESSSRNEESCSAYKSPCFFPWLSPGETTSGCKMKLVVNMLMGTFVAGLAESLALADKVGLDQDALLQILDLSVMSCPLVRSKGQGKTEH